MGLTSWIAKSSGLVKSLQQQNKHWKARSEKLESRLNALESKNKQWKVRSERAEAKLDALETEAKKQSSANHEPEPLVVPEPLTVRLARILEIQPPPEFPSPTGVTSSVDVSEYLQRATNLLELTPEWARVGRISPYDGAFLWKLIDECKPSRILEVGSLAGVSTSLLVEASLPIEGCHIDALDAATHCYFDKSRAIGEALPLMTSNALNRLTWHLGSPLANWRDYDAHRNSYDLIFIDANHGHPWPTLDILAALPLIKPGGWIALHDTFLSIKDTESRHRLSGVTMPFICWNGEKRVGSHDLRQGDCSALKVTKPVHEHAQAIVTTLFCRHESNATPAYLQSVLGLAGLPLPQTTPPSPGRAAS